MKYLRLTAFLLIVPLLFVINGCDKSTDPEPEPVNEAQVLVDFLEANGDYLNSASCPSIVAATDVYTTLQTSPSTQYIIDVRSSTDFTAGHIQGAVNVELGSLLSHVQGLSNASNYTRIVVTCYTGQSAAWGVMALRLMGFTNTYSLKWGMCSWDSTFHYVGTTPSRWLANMKNDRAAQFTTTATAKNNAGNFPTLSTGKTTGAEILAARVSAVLAEGYTPASISNSTLFTNLSGYYIVNYWPADQYAAGHVPGAVQYTPKADLKSTTYLKTLPTDKPVVVYCYTGQTSSFVAFWLRVMGYDGKSLLYGANAMIYDTMPGTKFVPATEIKGYPFVTGS